jgi:hypothetical protein
MDTYKRLSTNTNGLFTSLVEVWKDIEGYEGHYQISSFGRIKSMQRTRKSKGGTIARLKERILKQKTNKHGYLVIGLCFESKKYHHSVHKLVANAFISNCEQKPTVNHIDGDKQNNKTSNLEWATCSEQMRHAFANGLVQVRGSVKYDNTFKRNVLAYYKETNCSIMDLSNHFDISERTAGRIVNKGVHNRKTTRVMKSGETVIEDILSWQDVQKIKQLRTKGYTLKRLSELFNRGISQMHRICKNQTRLKDIN